MKQAIICMACDKPISPPRVSMSRFRNVWICADCGTREAFEGDHWEGHYFNRRDRKRYEQPPSFKTDPFAA